MSNNNEWFDIKGYEGLYQINKNGDIKSLSNKRNDLVKPRLNNSGHLFVSLSKKCRYTKKYIHKLLAETFIPNPNNKLVVNHINGIKTDNSITNLEWNTYGENIKHGYVELGRIPKNKYTK